MTPEKLEAVFIEFLNKKNLINKFIHNMQNFRLEGVEPNLAKPHSLLGSAFSWARSPEEFPFWSRIYKEWKVYIDNYKQE